MKNKLDKLREAAEKLFPADGSFHENQISYLTQEAFIAGATSKEAGEYWREQGWISVVDRLPTEKDADENGKVLIYRIMNEGQESLSKSVFDWFMVKYCDKETCWQPLPSPPKTDNQ